jgi:aryl sulfotransferase
MTAVRRYEASMYDSSRWEGFELRPGDIIISTPPKCGTTWTQMICALLILQEPELPLPLDTLSPWIDMVTRARTEVFADLEAQAHRRFIKTHTPLDGIPSDPAVTYICVGRDPRDVGLSMDRHIDNTDIGGFLSQRERAAAIDGIELGPLRPPRPRPGGERDRFWQWADDETPSTQVGSSLRRTVEHLQTFRDAAGDLDVVHVHYDDLKADLEGQMRQLAARLGIDVDEHRWPYGCRKPASPGQILGRSRSARPAFERRAGRSWSVWRWDDLRLAGLKLIFLVVTRAVSVLGLSQRESWWKDAEILMLRHQLAVALRERPRVHSRLTWPDRA